MIISVVVPVYNKQDSLAVSVDSLIGQTADASQYEIVLVDDGSVDNSVELCRSYAAKHANVRVVEQENKGVSGARNTGILEAQGDFVMFLDAGDYLSKTTIAELIKGIDAFGRQVDLVTYPIRYYNSSTDKSHYHKRKKWLEHTGVYQLDRYPSITQTTINVCARRRPESPILFNETMKMGEDQLFNCTNLLDKAAIGYCSKAEYVYVQDGSGASARRGNNPLYAFEDMVQLYAWFLDHAEQNPKMAAYLYEMFFNNIDWRLRGDLLFPEFGDAATRANNEERLANLFKRIPIKAYLASNYIVDIHKMYFVNKYFGDIVSSIEYGKESTTITLDGDRWESAIPALSIEQCYIEAQEITIAAHVVCSAFIYEDELSVSIKVNGETIPLEAMPSSFDYYSARRIVTKAIRFEAKIPYDGNDVTVEFRLSATGKPISNVRVVLSPNRHNGRIVRKNQLYNFGDVEVQARPNKLVFRRPGAKSKALMQVRDIYRRFEGTRLKLKRFLAQHVNERAWVYSDLPISSGGGNALAQILHDIEKKDGIRRFYITGKAEEILARHPELRGHMLPLGSDEHLKWFAKAEKVLASYLEWNTFLPLKHMDYMRSVADLGPRKELVYLQHGILHAHMPWYFSYDRIPFNKEVVSTSFELENLTQNYCFPENALILSGAPRFDSLIWNGKHERKIILAPSWRSFLVSNLVLVHEGNELTLKNSQFYRGIVEFVNGVINSGLLERFDCSLDIKLHPNFDVYQHCFEFDSDRVNLVESVDENEYAIAITDFSSYVFDFVYTGASVMYFLPDAEEFFAGINHYRELDLPFEQGFGPFCVDAEDAVKELERLLESESENGWGPAPNKARESFFIEHEGSSSERLYRSLSEG